MAKRLLWGYIDRSGEYVIAPRFDDAWDFHEDLAAVKVEWARGYIGRDGEFVITPRYEKAGDFKDGVARVMLDGEWLFIDRKGNPVAAPADFDPAPVVLPPEPPFVRREGDKVGYVDEAGEWVIPPLFHDAEPFREGCARVRKGKTSKWGFIGPDGAFLFPQKFDAAEDFHDSLARVLVKTDS